MATGNPESPIDLVSHKKDETEEATRVFQRELNSLQSIARHLIPVHVNENLDNLSTMIQQVSDIQEECKEDPEVTRAIHSLQKNLRQCKRTGTSFGECAELLADHLTNETIIERVREGFEKGDRNTTESFFREVHRRQAACSQELNEFIEIVKSKEVESGTLYSSVADKKKYKHAQAYAAELETQWNKKLCIGFGIAAIPAMIILPFGIMSACISIYFYLQFREAKNDLDHLRKCEVFYKNAMTTLRKLQTDFYSLEENMTNCKEHLKKAEKIVSHMIEVRINHLDTKLEQVYAEKDFTQLVKEVKNLEIDATSRSGHENI